MARGEAVILTLLAGGGDLPAVAAAAALAKGWKVNVVTFDGQPQPANLPDGLMRVRLPLVKVGKILDHLKAVKATHVALVGNLNKPGLLGLVPDAEGVKLLAGVGLRRVSGGDDKLLQAVVRRLEAAGLIVVGMADLRHELLAPEGALSKRTPTQAELKDAALGMAVLRALAPFDIGQACVVARGVVLGVEGVEGTDALIERCALLRGGLKPRERCGVLVKCAKAGQTDKADLPTLGPDTLAKLADYSFVGAFVSAGSTLLLHRDEMIRMADKRQLLLFGLKD